MRVVSKADNMLDINICAIFEQCAFILSLCDSPFANLQTITISS